MKTTYHPSGSRGQADYGWLQTRYSFSFADYYNPDKINFGALRVLNDDFVAGGAGFDLHPHNNMEIITLVLDGELRHTDSMNNTEVIRKDEVQVMTAGTGILHAEHNNLPDKPVKLLQIWIFPDKKNLTPRYDQKFFDPTFRRNKWQNLVAPSKPESLTIHKQAWISRVDLDKDQSIEYKLHSKGNGIYIFNLSGSFESGKEILASRDALEVMDCEALNIYALESSEILLLEVPMS